MQNNFTDPQIILKTYDFYKFYYLEIKKWPKPEKYNLGSKTETLILEIVLHLLAAARNINPRFNLIQSNLKLQLIRFHLRLAKELGLTTEKKYLFLSQNSIEIGKMLGGWLKKLS